MSIYLLFGLPGAGKTYVGKIFEKDFGFYFYDGDNELTEEMKNAISQKIPFTDKMRDGFFRKLILKIKELHKNQQKFVIAQTFIKEKYRKWVLDKIPEAKFILIKVKTEIRELRLKKRDYYPLDIEYSRDMCQNFENPLIPHQVIVNDNEGEENIKKQISDYCTPRPAKL